MDFLRIISIISSFFSAPDLFITHLIKGQFGKLLSRYYSQDIIYRFTKYQDISKVLDPDIILRVLKKALPSEILALEKDIKKLQNISLERLAKGKIKEVFKDILNEPTQPTDNAKAPTPKGSGGSKTKATGSAKPRKQPPPEGQTNSRLDAFLKENPLPKKFDDFITTKKPKTPKKGETKRSGTPPVPTPPKTPETTPPPSPKPPTTPSGKSKQSPEASSSTPINASFGPERTKLSSSWVQYGSFKPIAESVLGMLTIWVNSDKDPKHRGYGPYTYPYVNQDIGTSMKMAKGKNGTGAGSVMWQYFLRAWLPSALRGYVISHKEEFSQNTLARNKAFIQELTIRYASMDKTKIVRSQIRFGERQFQLAQMRSQARAKNNSVIRTTNRMKRAKNDSTKQTNANYMRKHVSGGKYSRKSTPNKRNKKK